MIPASEWYPHLAYLSFPMVFVPVDEEEAAVLAGDGKGRKARTSLIAKLDRAIGSIPGSCFVYADVCSPTDSAEFAKTKGAVRNGEAALKLLRGSDKVKTALRDKKTQRLVVRPFRRMDTVREFRQVSDFVGGDYVKPDCGHGLCLRLRRAVDGSVG